MGREQSVAQLPVLLRGEPAGSQFFVQAAQLVLPGHQAPPEVGVGVDPRDIVPVPGKALEMWRQVVTCAGATTLVDMVFGRDKTSMVSASDALPGRSTPLAVPDWHEVHRDRRIRPPFPSGMATAVFAMGCFWGAERVFWQTPDVYSTAVGYAGGYTPNPTYEEVCTGQTGHAEVVLVVYDPSVLSFDGLLKIFWENHDPTQGMRQGADVGTQYRSAVYYTSDAERDAAEASLAAFQIALTASGHGKITTELAPLRDFFYAEDYHQQYLAKNPHGYCGIGGTGVSCPIGVGVESPES